jgi:hypothetical protein
MRRQAGGWPRLSRFSPIALRRAPPATPAFAIYCTSVPDPAPGGQHGHAASPFAYRPASLVCLYVPSCPSSLSLFSGRRARSHGSRWCGVSCSRGEHRRGTREEGAPGNSRRSCSTRPTGNPGLERGRPLRAASLPRTAPGGVLVPLSLLRLISHAAGRPTRAESPRARGLNLGLRPGRSRPASPPSRLPSLRPRLVRAERRSTVRRRHPHSLCRDPRQRRLASQIAPSPC